MRAVTARAGKCVVGAHKLPLPRSSECIVNIHATAVNRADTLQRKGLYPPPPNETEILGLEMAGKLGDRRVMSLLAGGGNAECVAVDEALLMDIPPNLSFEQAAAIPETWLTAYQLLFLVADAQPGERILIHACGSGVGVAATQLAVRCGMTVYGTAGTEAKLETCRRLGAQLAVSYKDKGGFAPAVLSASDGAGVDIILDCVGGSHAAQNVAVMGMDARWVVYGLMGGPRLPADLPILAKLLQKRASIHTSTLRSRSLSYKRELTRRFAAHALPLFASGDYVPLIDATFPLDEVQAAHDHMESNANTGKIVLAVTSPRL